MALLAFGQGHAQGGLDGLGHALGVVGVDQQRLLELLGRAGEARQHQHAGVLRVLRHHVFLGHQVHAVAQRCDQAHARHAAQAGHALSGHGAVDVAQRHPVQIAEVAVDGATQSLQLLAQVRVGVHVVARGRGDHDQRGAVLVLGVALQQLAEGAYALGDALGVVQPVDAQQQLAARILLAHGLVGLYGVRRAAQALELLHIDADGKGAHLQLPAMAGKTVLAQPLGFALVLQVAAEVGHVGLALQAHQVIREERAHQPLVVRQRGQDQRWRDGDVQEKTDALAAPQRAQLRRQRDQVVVVHPDHVVVPQQRQQLAREQPVHAAVALHVVVAKVRQVQPVVKDRPQHAVGVALVVAGEVLLGQVHRGQGDAPGLALVQPSFTGRAARHHRAAPAKPQPARAVQGIAQRHRQPSGGGAARVGQPVGNDYKSAHTHPPRYCSSYCGRMG